ncbi:MAG: hypothetical protein U0271_31865 [Polyangiaceae bacterium]
MTVKVFLGGEGAHELGDRINHPSFSTTKPGTLEALLERVRTARPNPANDPPRWEVIGARQWKSIRKLRAKGPSPAEAQNVAGLLLEARERDADVLAFVRDSDGDSQREKDIHAAIAKERAGSVGIIGGVAVPVLEAWILAAQGKAKTGDFTKHNAQSQLGRTSTDEIVRIIEVPC